ncbi:MAG: hypothetical protein UMR38_01190 [Candidatus Izemoplasma sp.]|nr:hypothetical protein [Candidatus Izemoplasma sp.]
MRKIILGVSLIILVILLIFVGIYGYRGTDMTFNRVNLNDSSTLNMNNTVICEGYHREKITTYDEFVTFKSDCGLNDNYDINETYFSNQVIVIYLKLDISKAPTAFFDHPFSTQGIEVINYRQSKEATDDVLLYMIYADKESIISENVIFDPIT